ncbi:hypothetical protein HEAR1524 [Herminiimonas arsenicoxydans]|uniref:Uncharacterized protein n=1 Tax=Herminiimonas arsenicoxydans TaxID=204773 RepID=A4G5A4_HERAR|nr:hypothetical protein HEAR1524 [Herminiimonas arsenicoxydans]
MLKQIQEKLLFGLFMLLGLVSSAMAAVGDDPGVDAINALSGKATLYITASFAVAVLVAGGFWGIAMMKKAFSRAK